MSRTPPPAPHVFRRHVTRPGCEPLRYHSAGNGRQTIAIVNAHGESLDVWEPLRAELAQRFHVLDWQPRGTVWPGGGMEATHPIREHVDDMQAILRAEGVSRAHVIAWFTAPKIALEFHAAHPRTVASMTFIGGCFLPDPAAMPFQTRYERKLLDLCRAVGRRGDAMHKVVQELHDALDMRAPLGAPALAGAAGHAPMLTLAAPLRCIESLRHLAHQFLMDREHRLEGLPARPTVPVMFLCGDADAVASPRASRALAAGLPDALYAEVSGGSHHVHLELPTLVAQLLRGFIRDGSRFAPDLPGVRVERPRHAQE